MPLPAIPADLWFTDLASTFGVVDDAFYLVFWVCVVFFLIIAVGQAWFMFKYRRRPGHAEARTATHHTALELSWSIIPTLIVVVLFTYGFLGFLNLRTPPANAYDVNVQASKWKWLYEYPGGASSDELHAEVGMPVRAIMSSADVIHSLYLRDFRAKQDVVPGHYSYLWFEATKPGEYEVQCAEYCGRNHSTMRSKVVIHEKGELATWVAGEIKKLENAPPLELGEKLYNQRGCVGCHTLDGVNRVGPSFNQTYGIQHEFADGTKIAPGDNYDEYIRNSINDPQSQVRAGFPPTMPTFKGALSDRAIGALIIFIKSQNPKYRQQAEAESVKIGKELKAKAEAAEKAQGNGTPAAEPPAGSPTPPAADEAAAGGK